MDREVFKNSYWGDFPLQFTGRKVWENIQDWLHSMDKWVDAGGKSKYMLPLVITHNQHVGSDPHRY